MFRSESTENAYCGLRGAFVVADGANLCALCVLGC